MTNTLFTDAIKKVVCRMIEEETREWWEDTDREEAIEEIENTLNCERGYDDWDYLSWGYMLNVIDDKHLDGYGEPDDEYDDVYEEACDLYMKWTCEILRGYLNK